MEKLATLPETHPLGLQLPISAALIYCLQRCTNPDVFLLHLADRFMRLALQVCENGVTDSTWEARSRITLCNAILFWMSVSLRWPLLDMPWLTQSLTV